MKCGDCHRVAGEPTTEREWLEWMHLRLAYNLGVAYNGVGSVNLLDTDVFIARLGESDTDWRPDFLYLYVQRSRAISSSLLVTTFFSHFHWPERNLIRPFTDEEMAEEVLFRSHLAELMDDWSEYRKYYPRKPHA